jgi:hypothetical protein
MEQHLRVLQDAARKYRSGKLGAEQVYVWWGKLRSENRTLPLPHLTQVLALETEVARDDEGPETHLYLTDYASLYVAHLGEVRREPPERGDVRVPTLYRKLGTQAFGKQHRAERREFAPCDCWFKLWDIRRVVDNDTTEVAHELRKLGNTRYEGRPVSLYGGMVELPLIVTESKPIRYFDPTTRRSYAGDRLWVEFDAEQGGTGEMERELRENLFGLDAWRALGPTTRTFIASGERMFREHVRDQMFDLGLALLEYAKALEVHCNSLIRTSLMHASVAERCKNVDGRSRDLTTEALNLRELALALGDPELRHLFNRHLRGAEYLTGIVPGYLKKFADVRNRVAHQELVDRDEVVQWRNELCGIGCDGVLVRLAKVVS